jgi:alpha,alpha-trehalase
MRYLSLALALLLTSCSSLPLSPLPNNSITEEPPSVAYPDLFVRVAMSELYEPKDWADMRPKRPVGEIETAYDARAPMSDEELAEFVEANFEPSPEVGAELSLEEGLTLSEHIEALWPVLSRSAERAQGRGSLLPLPNPYIVPGGRFREAYYWDTYFTMLGLDGAYAELRRDVVENFAAALDRYGRIPNGNRTYYLSRSQPPFFYLMVGLLNETDPSAAWAEYLPYLQQEHRFWTGDGTDLQAGEVSGRSVAMPDGSILQRYYDDRDVPRDESYRYDVETAEASNRPHEDVYRDLRAGAESGWDFSSRWLDGGGSLASIDTTDIVPVDLNALLYGLERAIADGCERSGKPACAEEYDGMAARRKAAIERYFWAEDDYYADWDLTDKAVRQTPTAAMLYPLFTGMASDERGRKTLQAAERYLLAAGGILPTPERSGEQWDAPNGWAPHQWIAVVSSDGYGRPELADEVARRWVRTVARGYCESGKLGEKYDVVDRREGGGGEYPNQDGFGWTNGVTIRLINTDDTLSEFGMTTTGGRAEQCNLDEGPAARSGL